MPVRWTFPPSAGSGVDGATASTAALVDITPAPPPQIPPILEVGMKIRIHAHGWTTSGSATPTYTCQLTLAKPATAIASGTQLALSGAIALPASVTQGGWLLDWWGHVTAVSTPASATAGQISGRGRILPASSLTAYATDAPTSATYANRLSAGFDTTFAQNVLIGVTLSATTGSPQIACEELTVEIIG